MTIAINMSIDARKATLRAHQAKSAREAYLAAAAEETYAQVPLALVAMIFGIAISVVAILYGQFRSHDDSM